MLSVQNQHRVCWTCSSASVARTRTTLRRMWSMQNGVNTPAQLPSISAANDLPQMDTRPQVRLLDTNQVLASSQGQQQALQCRLPIPQNRRLTMIHANYRARRPENKLSLDDLNRYRKGGQQQGPLQQATRLPCCRLLSDCLELAFC